jgi:hypothetical protein
VWERFVRKLPDAVRIGPRSRTKCFLSQRSAAELVAFRLRDGFIRGTELSFASHQRRTKYFYRSALKKLDRIPRNS